jgi:hypothetical protein
MTKPTIDDELRERLAMAGCYPRRVAPGGGEIWFTPHLNREFTVERTVTDAASANAVLRRAGMEEAF